MTSWAFNIILDLVALAPKRPDWDLKRAIEPQLEKLKKKTERAIAELIRERLKATNDLAAQVAAAGPDMYWKFYCPNKLPDDQIRNKIRLKILR